MRRAGFAFIALLPLAAAQPGTWPFEVDRAGEAVADLEMSSPGADWAVAGHEAAVADVRVDGGPVFQVMLYGGASERRYTVFLGSLPAGGHRLSIDRNDRFSAPGTTVKVASVAVRGGINDPVVARAPVLYARKDTIGKFTDAPMVVYAEKFPGILQYTVIFTNEDGGTSTRALMARWGRTTDIEYVYRLDTATGRAIIQGKNHKDIEYRGKFEGEHPLLIPITDNNMVGDDGTSEIRYQIAPVLVDLSAHAREQVMDDDPLTYRVMAQELAREGKIRPFGEVRDQDVSDVRNYLYVEAKVAVKNAGVVTMVRRRDDAVWRTSYLGRWDYAVDRDGWITTTVELPPGTKLSDIAEIGFTCAVVPDRNKRLPVTGDCRIDSVGKVFLLDAGYRPGPSAFSMTGAVDIPAGLIRTWPVAPR